MASVAMSGETEEEKWVGLYSNRQKILLIGEGNFSFSACLARRFGSSYNMVATSYDSRKELETKYKDVAAHLSELYSHGCKVYHDIDVDFMTQHLRIRNQDCSTFDRVVFNFPHAGPVGPEEYARVILQHQAVVAGFLRNAERMIKYDGEVHVTHQDGGPYALWRLADIALWAGLVLVRKEPFRMQTYPGYQRKRGGSWRADEEFHLGYPTYTFIFKRKALYTYKAKTADVDYGDRVAWRAALDADVAKLEKKYYP